MGLTISLGKKAGGRHFKAWLSYATRPQAHLPAPKCWLLSPSLSSCGLEVAAAAPTPLPSTTAFEEREEGRPPPHPTPPSGLPFKARCPEVDQMTTPKPTTAKGELTYHNRLRLLAFSRDRCGRYHRPLGFWKCVRLSQQPGSAVGTR